MIAMIAGAARELAIGDPRDIATHIGPVIDAGAKTALDEAIAASEGDGASSLRGRSSARRAARGGSMSRRIFSKSRSRAISSARFSGRCSMSCATRRPDLDALLDDIERSATG